VNREELEHVVRAAAEITGDEIVVIGSQAVLGPFPDAPKELLRSMEADLYPRSVPSRASEIDGAIGDGSQFHRTYGYYAHGVGPESPHAPAGWEERMLRLDLPPLRARGERVTAWFLEVHDLALSKLAAGREKDVEFVAEALLAGLLDTGNLERGVPLMPEPDRESTADRLVAAFAIADRRRRGAAAAD
jgi:Nucleotidyltransferase of unknown function (DUF6036)